MSHAQNYSNNGLDNAAAKILADIDRNVERGEDLLMLGFGTVMLLTLFAPVSSPLVILPLIALAFGLSSAFARLNYRNMQRKLEKSMQKLANHEKAVLRPVAAVFVEYPMEPLAEALNPLKNLKRLVLAVFGGVLINPLWIPIFYMMGLHITAEKNLISLHRAILRVKRTIAPPMPDD